MIGHHDSAAHADGQLLEVNHLVVDYAVTGGGFMQKAGHLRAVDGVSLRVAPGETLAIVGESGSGKSTVARAVLRIVDATSGSIRLRGEDFRSLKGAELRRRRRHIQMVFQDPYSSLDPRRTVGGILAEPIEIHGIARGPAVRERSRMLLEVVGLDPEHLRRYPHEFSGGQRQRIGIARALSVEPDIIVCDEPVSALDVSIQAQVVNLLVRLQRELRVAYIFIAHDLAVVRQVAHRVAVMYLGKIVEEGPSDAIYAAATHPYTVALLSAVPVPDPRVERTRRRIILHGDIPNPLEPPPGCSFSSRCWLREALGNPTECVLISPPLAPVTSSGGDHRVACHFSSETRARMPGVRAIARSRATPRHD